MRTELAWTKKKIQQPFEWCLWDKPSLSTHISMKAWIHYRIKNEINVNTLLMAITKHNKCISIPNNMASDINYSK